MIYQNFFLFRKKNTKKAERKKNYGECAMS